MYNFQSIILVIGPKLVGKTEIINQITNGSYNTEFYPNNGHDYSVKLARMPQQYQCQVSKIFEVQPIIWDGKELGLIRFYAQISDIVLLVVDATDENQNSQEFVEKLFHAAQERYDIDYFKETNDKRLIQPKIYLLANLKGKGINMRKNQFTTWLSQFCRLNSISLYEVDSTNPENIQMTFIHILQSNNFSNRKFTDMNRGYIDVLKSYFQPLQKASRSIGRFLKHIQDEVENFRELMQ